MSTQNAKQTSSIRLLDRDRSILSLIGGGSLSAGIEALLKTLTRENIKNLVDTELKELDKKTASLKGLL